MNALQLLLHLSAQPECMGRHGAALLCAACQEQIIDCLTWAASIVMGIAFSSVNSSCHPYIGIVMELASVGYWQQHILCLLRSVSGC